MLGLPQQTLDKIKKRLLNQQKDLEDQLKAITEDDPISVEAVAEASESGTDSWQAEVHGRVVALKNDLMNFSKRVASSIMRLNQGTYGKCEKCGKEIEALRLEAMPTATLCMACSKKPSRR